MLWSSLHVPQIEDFEDTEWQKWSNADDLPKLIPHFDISPLEDKPQNPILETLKLEQANPNLPSRRPGRPTKDQSHIPLLLKQDVSLKDDWESQLKVWKEALERKPGLKANLCSWDRLRVSHPSRASATPYLTERDDAMYAAARFHTQPQFVDPSTIVVHIDGYSLLKLLKHTVLGISSTLFAWNSVTELFVQRGTEGSSKKGFIMVDGLEQTASLSFISRFLSIGTLLRRLETFTKSLRGRPAREGPTIHAFAHALASCLIWLRDALGKCPPEVESRPSDEEKLRLTAVWNEYAIYHDILIALAELCMRGEELQPQDYPELESSPVSLLSRIYQHLELQLERRSTSTIIAVLAFILTASSQEYIQRVAYAIGFGGLPPFKPSLALKDVQDEYDFDEDDEEQEDIFDLMGKVQEAFPSFFPLSLRRLLPAAQRSLILLNIAQAEHSLLTVSSNHTVRWIWGAEEIKSLWKREAILSRIPALEASPPSTRSSTVYKPDLADFALFDLEPGTPRANSSIIATDNASSTLHNFIKAFPKELPAITPTLSQLTSLVFHDLSRHATTLSSTLLSHFLDSEGTHNFRSHLLLLRSFLLISAPAFKSRLLAALLSDAGEYEVDNTPHSMSIRYLRRPTHRRNRESKQPWAVGISPNLLDRETWPPVGADLSFFLRTVIIDSLDRGDDEQESEKDEAPKKNQVTEEASWRLGFAIRDLPVGSGRDKWLDPLSIEALDFLYMDYKPPHPMEILISPGILSKYQRMFAFLLRLLRVESALKSLFRMTTHRAIDKFLFPTLVSSRKLLLHFRFIAQSFVSTLSGYVFDTVIGGSFDFFLSKLSSRNEESDTAEFEKQPHFSDVFELARGHSALLDDILSACLLRSGQRGMSDLLRQALETILKFTIVIGELHRGRLEEYQAAPLIEDLFAKFRTKMATFTKTLKGLGHKSPSASAVDNMTAGRTSNSVGGQHTLYHLLIRMDLGDWWTKRSSDSINEG